MIKKSKKPAKKSLKAKTAKKAPTPGLKKNRRDHAGKITRGTATVRESVRDTAAKFRSEKSFLSLAVSLDLDVDKLMLAKDDWSTQLLRPRPVGFSELRAAPSPSPESNVVGVGIGEQIAGGKHTGTIALKFFVRVKYADDQLTPSDKLPESVNGVPTDIEQVGTFRSFHIPNPRTIIRPGPPGCSVGFENPGGQVMAGTFGALVKRGTRRFVLSNNHVLANENGLPIGAPTFQPGFLDAGVPARTGRIGKLSAFVELRALLPNLVDCAISEIDDPTLVTNSIIKIGVPKGATMAQSNMIVHKFGRTTGYTVGFVQTTLMDVRVDFGLGELKFQNQIIIKGLNGQAFSTQGDSGALIVERNTSRAIGLLFAGSTSHTIANHIGNVFQALNVSLS